MDNTRDEPIKPLLLISRDAAAYLAMCERKLWSLTWPRGPIPVIRIGRSVRYNINDLEAFASSCSKGPTSEIRE